MSYIILNGELKLESEIRISPVNRGLMYGDGCFETFRSYNGKFLALDAHIQRLASALDYLGLNYELQLDTLKAKIAELLHKKVLTEKDAFIRIQCWREGKRGFSTDSDSMNWLMQADEIFPNKAPLKLALATSKSIPNKSLERKFKLSNSLNFILAAIEAKKKTADDALLVNIQNYVSETTISNIFWIHNNTLFTPSFLCDILPGITRNMIIELAAQHSISVEQGEFSIPHLKSAEAAFCTNSVREIQEVNSLDDVKFEAEHPLVKKIKILFEEYKSANLKS